MNEPQRAASERPRIVDAVFASYERAQRASTASWPLALLVALGAHASLLVYARAAAAPSLEPWAADLVTKIRAALEDEQPIEVAKPPPPAPEEEAPRAPRAPHSEVAKRSTPSVHPQPPAQAGAILSQEPDPNAPVDLTGETFVTGNADAYAGGVTARSGTARHAVRAITKSGPSPTPHASGGNSDRARPVSLEEQNWSCPWPREAEGEAIDEQVVVLRVVVRPDGSAESANLIHGVDHGFGRAALACALRTRFVPARDTAGHPVRAQSPPIVVRFTR